MTDEQETTLVQTLPEQRSMPDAEPTARPRSVTRLAASVKPASVKPASVKPASVKPAQVTSARVDPPQPATVTTPKAEAEPLASPSPLPVAPPSTFSYRTWLLWAAGILAVPGIGYLLVPIVLTALNTVSTDDAYVNGHVTMVAPRVAGQVIKVLVDDNYRVKKGDVLVQLDKEPFRIQVALKQAAVQVAEATLTAAEAGARGLEAQLGGQRWKLQLAAEQVDAQVAALRAQVAVVETQNAMLVRARADYERAENVAQTPGAISPQDIDKFKAAMLVAEASLNQAREAVHQIRASLGLSPEPEQGKSLSDVPPDLNQTFAAVRTALADCLQTMTQLGLPLSSTNLTPDKALAEFRERSQDSNLDLKLQDLIPKVPAVLQAKAALEQARHDLEQAELNLKYCDIVSEIDGVVTGRNINPGNDVQVGQSLLAVRSLTQIWIDANFKETQLSDLRIGQRVQCEVDMYGSHREFTGRISGFTMGTGQTLALLPPQNATGNFVKIVQRLPVRIELTNYDPEPFPLFVGLSVTPYVYYKEPPTGPHAGSFLQASAALPTAATDPHP